MVSIPVVTSVESLYHLRDCIVAVSVSGSDIEHCNETVVLNVMTESVGSNDTNSGGTIIIMNKKLSQKLLNHLQHQLV